MRATGPGLAAEGRSGEVIITPGRRGVVVGLGSMGRRHLATLRHLLPGADLTAVPASNRSPDQLTAAAAVAADAGADRLAPNLHAALALQPHFAVVASPAPSHLLTAAPLVEAGVPLLVEKPLAADPASAADLVERARAAGVTLMVGYTLRFAAGLRFLHERLSAGAVGEVLAVHAEVGQHLAAWRPGRDHRRSVSARADLGGGALNELSHELDLARWLAGEVRAVTAVTARVGDVTVDTEDWADLALDFAAGAAGAVHLDLVRHAPIRSTTVVGSAGSMRWDGLNDAVCAAGPGAPGWSVARPGGCSDRTGWYRSELRHFLSCAATGEPPCVDGGDGLAVVRLVAAARRSARTGAKVEVAP